MASHISGARYGKDNVRVLKVERDQKTGFQTAIEMTVRCLLEGEIETSYTEADNSVVVATDSIKNTIFILAKQHPVTPPELFGSIIASHFTTTYKHIHAAFVNIVTHRWTRLNIDGKAHPHSFIKDSQETRNIDVEHHEGQGFTITSGIKDLSVLKSTGSAFHGFVRDEYTTLKEAWDRILSTDVDSTWKWTNFKDLAAIQDVIPKFDAAWAAARDITLDLFAKENSPSVQATMYNMSNAILAAEPLIETVSYSLPNKHYFELDLSWHKGIKNTGQDAEVYVPQTNPNGLIKVSVSRGPSPSQQ